MSGRDEPTVLDAMVREPLIAAHRARTKAIGDLMRSSLQVRDDSLRAAVGSEQAWAFLVVTVFLPWLLERPAAAPTSAEGEVSDG